jgi:hypothetical protein
MQLRVIRDDFGSVAGIELNPGGQENPFWMPLPWNPQTRMFEPQTESHANWMAIAQGLSEWATLDLTDHAVQIPLAEMKLSITAQINEYSKKQFEALIFPYSTEEALSWDRKVAEAKAALSSGQDALATVAPSIVLEAQTRGVPVLAFAQVVLKKAEVMSQRAAKISGTRGMHCDRVTRIATLDELQAYDWLAGWN